MAERLKWYVYELIDPVTDTAFYIGKGCGNRMLTHLSKSHNVDVNTKISQIRRAGREPIARAVAYFYFEIDAFRYESERISESEGLCNKAKGQPTKTVDLFGTLFGLFNDKFSEDEARRRVVVCEGLVKNLPEGAEGNRIYYEQILDCCKILVSKVGAGRYAY